MIYAGLGGRTLAATQSADLEKAETDKLRLGHSCRMTVVRRECHTDLQALFLEDSEAGPCKCFESGQEQSLTKGMECPEGFCPLMWSTICRGVASSPCSATLHNSVKLVCCPDGTRPVIVRLDIDPEIPD